MIKIGSSTSHVTGPRGSKWRIDYQWATVAGRAEVVDLRLRSLDEPPIPITTTLLRSLNIGSDIDSERGGWASALVDLAADDSSWTKASDAMRSIGKPRGGHPPLPISDLADVADTYRRALAENRSPTQAVAAKFHLSQSGAAKRVRRARDEGLLPPTTPGVAAAHTPTKKGRKR